MYQRILVPIDGSPLSKKAVASAIVLMTRCAALPVGGAREHPHLRQVKDIQDWHVQNGS